MFVSKQTVISVDSSNSFSATSTTSPELSVWSPADSDETSLFFSSMLDFFLGFLGSIVSLYTPSYLSSDGTSWFWERYV